MTTAFDPLKITDDDLRKLEREELEAVADKALRQAAELDRALGEWFFTPEELEQPPCFSLILTTRRKSGRMTLRRQEKARERSSGKLR